MLKAVTVKRDGFFCLYANLSGCMIVISKKGLSVIIEFIAVRIMTYL
jgi:hypothetical protein